MNYSIELSGSMHRIAIKASSVNNRWHVLLDDQEYSADAEFLQEGVLSLLVAGKSYRIFLDPRIDGNAVVVGAQRMLYQVEDPRSLRSRTKRDASETGARSVGAPMPGRIVRILVQVGDTVAAQQGLLVMEAMKMQNELKSPKSGKVTRISVEPGATVQPGQALLVIE